MVGQNRAETEPEESSLRRGPTVMHELRVSTVPFAHRWDQLGCQIESVGEVEIRGGPP
jgi:hypothetical protein